jgi:integrase
MFDALRRWDNFLQAEGLSPDTRRAYRYHLLRFLADAMVSPEEVTEDDITEFLSLIRQRGRQVDMFLRALKSFYAWALRRGIVEVNPADAVGFKKSRRQPAQSLTEEEFTRVVIAAAWHCPQRAWAIILLLETGARIGSMAAVLPEDTGTEAGQLIRFRVAKGDRPYAVPLSPLAAEAVRELLSSADETLIGVRKESLWRWFHEAALEAGLAPGKRHPHILRDTFATNLFARKGVNARVVQDLLNHSDLTQMARYVAVTDPEKFAAMAEASFGTNYKTGTDL